MRRRQFLLHGAAVAGAGLPGMQWRGAAAKAQEAGGTADDRVAGLEPVTIRPRGKDAHGWCHARGCLVPGPTRARALLTVQPIYGSDHFGQVHWMESPAGEGAPGDSWTEPQPIPSLGYRQISAEMKEGVCDVVPEYHAATQTVLAIGHNVFYKDRFFRPQPPRWPVYVVRNAAGRWSEARRLVWDDPRTTAIYSCGCAQRINLPNGNVLIPLTFCPLGRQDHAVTTVLASFDGQELCVRDCGNELRLPVLRGLLEPSLAVLDGRYYMTIRAEDDRGYVTTSGDGLHWQPIRQWCWDDGEPLVMSTTQQRWLVHPHALYLVYTRKSAENAKLFRWRAPLYMARVDHRSLRLVRATERIAVAMEGDAQRAPERVPQLGNFHTMPVGPRESWITVADFDPTTWHGGIRMARVRWSM